MVSYLTTCAGLTEAVHQNLVHIPSQVTENLPFSNRRERVKLFHDRMCMTRGSISRPLKRQNDRPIFSQSKNAYNLVKILLSKTCKNLYIYVYICSAQSKNRYDSGIVPAQSRNPTLPANSGIVPDNFRIAQGIYIGLPSDIFCVQSKNRVGQSRNLMGSAK